MNNNANVLIVGAGAQSAPDPEVQKNLVRSLPTPLHIS
jgi:hypothetical protein